MYNSSIDLQSVRALYVLREGGFVFVALTLLKLSCKWITVSSKALAGAVVPTLALYLIYLIGTLPCYLVYHMFTKERSTAGKEKDSIQEPLCPLSESQKQDEELELALSTKLVRLKFLEHSDTKILARLSLRPTKRLRICSHFYTYAHF